MAGTTINPYRYGGQVGYRTDAPSRTYIRDRHLESTRGRWLSRDPLASIATTELNFYWFANNRPTTLVDPTGDRGTVTKPEKSWWCKALTTRMHKTCDLRSYCGIPGLYTCRQLKDYGKTNLLCAQQRKLRDVYCGWQSTVHTLKIEQSLVKARECFARYKSQGCGKSKGKRKGRCEPETSGGKQPVQQPAQPMPIVPAPPVRVPSPPVFEPGPVEGPPIFEGPVELFPIEI